MSDKPFYKSWSFWLLFIALSLVLAYIFLGEPFESQKSDRILYGGISFVSILIANLLYLLFSKEENRANREKKISNFWAKRKEQKAHEKEEQKLEDSLQEKFNHAKKVIADASIYESVSYQNYELPWYLVIGEESSQKASILRNSGLDFPVNISYKESEYRDNQDDMSSFRWFFSEESIFINIPSAYVSTDADRLEKVVWNEFLRLFKKERWRRPVNGIILTLNVERLLHSDEEELIEYSKVLRTRFDELSKAFFSDIPIYVIISGLESLDGFYEYFNTLTDEEKREILGVTFNEKLLNITENTIATKLSLLHKRLENDSLDKLYRELSVESRAKAYFFTDQFKKLINTVTSFNTQLFSKTRFHAPLMLRGIYFTSVENPVAKGIFLPKVFERIILSESNLVKIDKNYKRKYTILQWFLIVILTSFVIGSSYYWLVFFNQESSEVPKVEHRLTEYHSLLKKSMNDLERLKREIDKKQPRKKISDELGTLGGVEDDGVSFKSNRFELTEFAKDRLTKIIVKIRTSSYTDGIKIIGHTDSYGSFENNKILSLNRAKSVKSFLLAHGITNHIITVGKGEAKPIAENSTKEGRSINRRVEIVTNHSEESEPHEIIFRRNLNSNWSDVLKLFNLLCLDDDCNRDISSEFWKPGYYKVAKRDSSIQKLYHKNLNLLLLSRVAILIERELLNNLDDRARTTYTLQAYLLLKNKEKREENPEYLKKYMLERWEDIDSKEKSLLNKHFDKLLSIEMIDIKLNEESIRKARSAILANSSEIKFYYNRMQTIIASTAQINAFRFKDEVLSSELNDGSYEVSGIYTQEGYRKVMAKSSRKILKSVIKDNWILGKTEEYSPLEFERLFKKVLRLYFRDYRKEWDVALSKISIVKHHDSDALAEQLSDFSSTESPIVEIIRALKKNTYLLTTAERMNESKNAVTSKIEKLIVKKDVDEEHKLNMRAYYKEYYKLLTKEGQPSSKLEAINKQLRKVYQEMLSVDNPTGSINDKLKKDLEIKFKKLPTIVGNWYGSILSQNWKEIDRGVKTHLKNEYKDVKKEYLSKIANKFPLNPRAHKDVDINYFVAFFKKDGIWESYYKQYEEEVNRNSALNMSSKIKRTMARVKKIQDLLFNGGKTGLEITFDIAPIHLDPNFLSMEIEYKSQLLKHDEDTPSDIKRFILSENDNPLSAKFKLYDFSSMPIVNIEKKGRWALLKLLYRLNPQKRGNSVIRLSSSGCQLMVKGKSANLLSSPNILQKFRLPKS